MFSITEDDAIKTAVILAFRGSAKSTIMSLSYPIWSMITGKKKFIIILSPKPESVQANTFKYRTELENNALLNKDLAHLDKYLKSGTKIASYS